MKSKAKLISAFLAVLLLLSAFGLTAFAESGSTTLTTTIPCTVTLQVGEHGKVTVDGTDYTGNTSFQRDAGTAVTYTFTPNGLYSMDKVIYNGTEVTGELSGNTWTAPALTGNAALSVSFKLIGGGTPTYTVTFDANGHGTAPASQTVLSGYTATEPTAPTAAGWVFGGWYKEVACTNAFDFATPITGNITLYAKWTEEGTTPVPTYYTVTFDANGHGIAPAVQTVESGKTAAKPADPTETGWVFGGWYKEKECTNSFDFATPITGNITLYAKWTVAAYTVTFDANGHGTAPAAQTVEHGKTAAKPANPTASGWTFKGWYKEAACTNAYDFSTAVTGDITLYAKWVKDSGGSPGSPKTGDNSHLGLWLALSVVSAGGVIGLTVYSRKRRKKAE